MESGCLDNIDLPFTTLSLGMCLGYINRSDKPILQLAMLANQTCMNAQVSGRFDLQA